MDSNLIKRIEDFITKQYVPDSFSRGGRKLKPYLKVGGKLLPRMEAERRKMTGRIGRPSSGVLPKGKKKEKLYDWERELIEGKK